MRRHAPTHTHAIEHEFVAVPDARAKTHRDGEYSPSSYIGLASLAQPLKSPTKCPKRASDADVANVTSTASLLAELSPTSA